MTMNASHLVRLSEIHLQEIYRTRGLHTVVHLGKVSYNISIKSLPRRSVQRHASCLVFRSRCQGRHDQVVKKHFTKVSAFLSESPRAACQRDLSTTKFKYDKDSKMGMIKSPQKTTTSMYFVICETVSVSSIIHPEELQATTCKIEGKVGGRGRSYNR